MLKPETLTIEGAREIAVLFEQHAQLTERVQWTAGRLQEEQTCLEAVVAKLRQIGVFPIAEVVDTPDTTIEPSVRPLVALGNITLPEEHQGPLGPRSGERKQCAGFDGAHCDRMINPHAEQCQSCAKKEAWKRRRAAQVAQAIAEDTTVKTSAPASPEPPASEDTPETRPSVPVVVHAESPHDQRMSMPSTTTTVLMANTRYRSELQSARSAGMNDAECLHAGMFHLYWFWYEDKISSFWQIVFTPGEGTGAVVIENLRRRGNEWVSGPTGLTVGRSAQ